jgi:hypothetical protein
MESFFESKTMKEKKKIVNESDLSERDKAILLRNQVKFKHTTPSEIKKLVSEHRSNKIKQRNQEDELIFKTKFDMLDEGVQRARNSQQEHLLTRRLKNLGGKKKRKKITTRKNQKCSMKQKRKQRKI